MSDTMCKSILSALLLAIAVTISLPGSGQTGGASSGCSGATPGCTGQATGTGRTPLPATQSPTAAGGGTASANPLAASDQKFVTDAVKGGVAEVKLGQLALTKAQAPEVKAVRPAHDRRSFGGK